MAVDKLVDSTLLDANLASVANAIRAKGGTSAQMAFPSGFVSAVQAIPTGGGLQLLGSGAYTYEGSAAGNITFPVSYTGVPKILLCLKDSQDAGVGETLGCYKVLATGIPTIDDAFTKGTCAFLIKSTADALSYATIAPGDTNCIYLCTSNGAYDPDGSYMRLVRYGNAYLLQPGGYSYYIYG